MNWSKGISARYEFFYVDPVSFMDVEKRDFTSGTITRTLDGLLQSADLMMTEDPGERWVRVYLDARQSGAGERVPLFTGLTSAPEGEWNGTRRSIKVECYSALKPCDDILTERGFYAPSGASGADFAAALLGRGIAKAYAERGSPTLADHIVAEDKETCLSMARKIVDAINWQIRIDGMGLIHIEPKPSDPKASFDPRSHDVIEPHIKDKRDWFSCPNYFRAISGDRAVVAKDETSSLSIGARGREIQREESATLSDGETLEEYAMRRLKELQSPSRTISYTRRYDPDIWTGSLIQMSYPHIGINGVFRVSKQTITLGLGCPTQEEAVMI